MLLALTPASGVRVRVRVRFVLRMLLALTPTSRVRVRFVLRMLLALTPASLLELKPSNAI
jgi:hypothetical protein